MHAQKAEKFITLVVYYAIINLPLILIHQSNLESKNDHDPWQTLKFSRSRVGGTTRGSQEGSRNPLNQRVERGKIVSRGPGRKVARIRLANRSCAAVLFAENGGENGIGRGNGYVSNGGKVSNKSPFYAVFADINKTGPRDRSSKYRKDTISRPFSTEYVSPWIYILPFFSIALLISLKYHPEITSMCLRNIFIGCDILFEMGERR